MNSDELNVAIEIQTLAPGRDLQTGFKMMVHQAITIEILENAIFGYAGYNELVLCMSAKGPVGCNFSVILGQGIWCGPTSPKEYKQAQTHTLAMIHG